MKYIPRWMELRLFEALKSHPVIILTGPRQVGKSTMLEHSPSLKKWRYLTLDDPDVLEQANDDPKGLFSNEQPTIVDEAQRCPAILTTIKYFVDKSRRKRQFILSGSGNISLRKGPRETLAGRAKYLYLNGFAFREMHGLSSECYLDEIIAGRDIKPAVHKSNADVSSIVWRGGLPAVALALNDKTALERLSAYTDTYIQRDIQDLVKIRHPQNFRRLMTHLAEATGWESVHEELSKVCSETRTNVTRYISLLKETQLLCDIKGYVTKGERAYKRSKYYWFDSGIASFLAGINSSSDIKTTRVKGRFFENFVLQQLLAWASLKIITPGIFYWQPKNTGGGEVDFVISIAGSIIGVEVKSANEVTFGDTRMMREFLRIHPQATRGIMIYTGDKIYPVATNIYAVPWHAI